VGKTSLVARTAKPTNVAKLNAKRLSEIFLRRDDYSFSIMIPITMTKQLLKWSRADKKNSLEAVRICE